MKCSLGISNFLEEISSLSHSIVFLYFFSLITEKGFLISPCYSLELCIQLVYLSFSPLPFRSFLFSAICKASLNNHFPFLHFFFLEMVFASCPMSWTSVHSSSSTLSVLIPWIYLSLPLYNCKGFDLGHSWMVNYELRVKQSKMIGQRECRRNTPCKWVKLPQGRDSLSLSPPMCVYSKYSFSS